jgi:hypothetical protein
MYFLKTAQSKKSHIGRQFAQSGHSASDLKNRESWSAIFFAKKRSEQLKQFLKILYILRHFTYYKFTNYNTYFTY